MLLELAVRYVLPTLLKELVGRSVDGLAYRAIGRPVARRAVIVISDIPGRVRIRMGGLRGDAVRAAAVVRSIQGQPGIHQVSANPLTGTVLVHYDPTLVELSAIKSRLQGRPPRRRSFRQRIGPRRIEKWPQAIQRSRYVRAIV